MQKDYFFQNKKRSLAYRFFDKGLNTSACILFVLKETGENFLRNLPDCYPGFKFWKDMFGVSNYPKPSFQNSTIRTNIQQLIKDGLVEKQEKSKKFSLTDKGKELVNYIENHYQLLKKPWDGKMRIIIFDIPETLKAWRRVIRQELLLLQYQQLQKSVYIGKYPIPENFCKEIDQWKLNKYIFIFTVDSMSRQNEIMELFE